MNDLDRLIRAILEADGDEDIKDLLGPDYGAPPDRGSKTGSVDRHGRWANINIGDDNWCISYLTPVAVFIHGQGAFITDRHWSATTTHHIVKWANEVGWGSGMPWKEIQQRAKVMSQAELIQKFKQDQKFVKWTKGEMRAATTFRDTAGLKSDSAQRVELEPYDRQ